MFWGDTATLRPAGVSCFAQSSLKDVSARAARLESLPAEQVIGHLRTTTSLRCWTVSVWRLAAVRDGQRIDDGWWRQPIAWVYLSRSRSVRSDGVSEADER